MKEILKKKNGSVTVEASLVLPLFLIFTIQVFSLFEILTIFTRLQAACEETAVEAAVFLALSGDATQSEEMSFLLSETLIREEIIRKADLGKAADSVILGGLAGLHFFRCDLATDGENVEIIVTYRVKPRLCPDLLGKVTLVNHSKVRAWTGFERESILKEPEDSSEEIVYVTPSGEAYHLFADCSYLKAGVQRVDGGELGSLRNNERKIYYPCEYCAKGEGAQSGSTYYITPWGTRFHTGSTCIGLEKQVTGIPLSEVGTRHLCSKCAKRNSER